MALAKAQTSLNGPASETLCCLLPANLSLSLYTTLSNPGGRLWYLSTQFSATLCHCRCHLGYMKLQK